jgi:hypothetical protein
MKRHFNNTIEKDSAPKWYTRKLLFEMVKNIQVVFRKGTVKGQKRKKTPTSTRIPFKKQSIFFMYLSYWKDLETCHSIYLMHVTKNVFDNIIGTNVKHYLPPASYSLTIEEKKHSISACVGSEYPQFLIQHQQTSLSERLVYVRLQFSQLSYDDDGFSHNHNKGHQTDAYQSTHHMLV